MAEMAGGGAWQAGGGPVWLEADPGGVAENLALDEVLLEAVETGSGGAVVRAWMAGRPAVVIGASSRVSEEVDLEACAAAGAEIYRRPSGGMSVVIGPGCVMWSVVWPASSAVLSLGAIHAAVLGPLAAALTVAGRPVVRRGTSDLAVASDDGERKVAGTALRVRRHACLYHGTLLDAFDLDLVGRLLRHPPREPAYRAGRRHRDFLANLALGRPAVEAAVRTAFAAVETRRTWPAAVVTRLARERYCDPAWTGRMP